MTQLLSGGKNIGPMALSYVLIKRQKKKLELFMF